VTMICKLFRTRLLVPCLALVAFVGNLAFGAQGADLKFQVQLVWATDDSGPPAGKDYKPVDPSIKAQLRALKWKNYFEVKHIDFSVAPASEKRVAISEKCELSVKSLAGSNVEVVLYGKGKEVARVKQALPKGEILVPGGNAPNETAWLAILKRVD
jgi:hypothetical protein